MNEVLLTKRRPLDTADFRLSPNSLQGLHACKQALVAPLENSIKQMTGSDVVVKPQHEIQTVTAREIEEYVKLGRLIGYREEPEKSRIFFFLTPKVWTALIDITFGAKKNSGNGIETIEPGRVENKVLEKIADILSITLVAALMQFFKIKKLCADLLLEYDNKDETLEWCELNYRCQINDDVLNGMSILIPSTLIQSNLINLRNEPSKDRNVPSADAGAYTNIVKSSEVTVSAIVERSHIPLSNLLALKIGDSFELKEIDEQFVTLVLNDTQIFSGSLKQTGSHYSVIVKKTARRDNLSSCQTTNGIES